MEGSALKKSVAKLADKTAAKEGKSAKRTEGAELTEPPVVIAIPETAATTQDAQVSPEAKAEGMPNKVETITTRARRVGAKVSMRAALAQEDAALAGQLKGEGADQGAGVMPTTRLRVAKKSRLAGEEVAAQAAAGKSPPEKVSPKSKSVSKAQVKSQSKAQAKANPSLSPPELPQPALVPMSHEFSVKELPLKEKESRDKVVRDSFSLPKGEAARLKSLRTELARTGRICSKSELLRAGLALLASLPVADRLHCLEALPVVSKGKARKR